MNSQAGFANIRGKNYKLVVKRVDEFRKAFKGYGIDTKIIDLGHESGFVVVETKIYDTQNRIVASGYAEEKRNSTKINQTSAVENCETSSIGRALACIGLGGDSYASAEELVSALAQQQQKEEPKKTKPPVESPPKNKGLLEKLLKSNKEVKIDIAEYRSLINAYCSVKGQEGVERPVLNILGYINRLPKGFTSDKEAWTILQNINDKEKLKLQNWIEKQLS
tara:strand:+ start:3408 stop:4073 length:666 start_codon:yes stop_codon:yes gene_type:complete